MKNLKKISAAIAMFVGLFCLSCLDSDIPLWCTFLLVLVGVAGFIGGAVLWSATNETPDID